MGIDGRAFSGIHNPKVSGSSPLAATKTLIAYSLAVVGLSFKEIISKQTLFPEHGGQLLDAVSAALVALNASPWLHDETFHASRPWHL